jgi:hypothetical protein
MTFAPALAPTLGIFSPAPAVAESPFPTAEKPVTKRRTMQDEQSRRQDDELIERAHIPVLGAGY